MTSGNVAALLSELLVSLNCLKATMGETRNACRILEAGLAWRILDGPMDWGVLCLVPWTDSGLALYGLALYGLALWASSMYLVFGLALWTASGQPWHYVNWLLNILTIS